MRSITRLLTVIGAALGLAIAGSQVQAVEVDLELVLAVDVSTSVDASEFDLQKDGYEAAFRNAAIATAIADGAFGAIAVSLVYWATSQVQAIDWFLIDGSTNSEASDFADAIDATSRPMVGAIGCCTGIAGAIAFSDALFDDNGFEGTRTVIDVSGDGEENITDDAGLDAARDAALASFTDAINGLAITTNVFPNLDTYYENHVIGGPGSFVLEVDGFEDFEGSIDDKLIREITPVPEPGTLMLLAIGLLLIGGMMRQKMRSSVAV